jgi:hypothetical protein
MNNTSFDVSNAPYIVFLATPWREQVTFGAILMMSEAGTLS